MTLEDSRDEIATNSMVCKRQPSADKAISSKTSASPTSGKDAYKVEAGANNDSLSNGSPSSEYSIVSTSSLDQGLTELLRGSLEPRITDENDQHAQVNHSSETWDTLATKRTRRGKAAEQKFADKERANAGVRRLRSVFRTHNQARSA